MIRALPSWTENLGKRVRKAPKIFLRDTGVLHALLGIRSMRDLQGHPKLGASWEGLAIEHVLRVVGSNRARRTTGARTAVRSSICWCVAIAAGASNASTPMHHVRPGRCGPPWRTWGWIGSSFCIPGRRTTCSTSGFRSWRSPTCRLLERFDGDAGEGAAWRRPPSGPPASRVGVRLATTRVPDLAAAFAAPVAVRTRLLRRGHDGGGTAGGTGDRGQPRVPAQGLAYG